MIAKAASSIDLDWVEEEADVTLSDAARGIVVTDDDGFIHGVVAYDNWKPNSVQMHIALRVPIAGRQILRPAFEYPFCEVGVGVVLAQIPAGNRRSLRLARHVGFTDSGRVRDGWMPGQDLVLLEMRKEHCRWLGEQRKVA